MGEAKLPQGDANLLPKCHFLCKRTKKGKFVPFKNTNPRGATTLRGGGGDLLIENGGDGTKSLEITALRESCSVGVLNSGIYLMVLVLIREKSSKIFKFCIAFFILVLPLANSLNLVFPVLFHFIRTFL